MKKSALFLTSTVVVFAATAITFGAHHLGDQTGPPLDQQMPGPLANANFGKILSGEFNGDLKRDAVLMDGSTAKVVITPEVHDCAISLPGPVNDIAVIGPDTVAPGVPYKDGVLTVSSAGLVRYDRDTANSEWDTTVIRGPVSAWANARLVAVGNLNGVGKPDIAGIAANGRDVLILYANTTTGYTAGTTFSAVGTSVYGLSLVNWSGSATKEIALYTNAGTEIRSAGGLLLASVGCTTPIFGTVIKDQGTALERLAMISPIGGHDMFFVYGSVKSEGPFDMGTACTVSMASGDADGDGDSEVFIGVNNAKVFRMVVNGSPGSTTFNLSAIVDYPYGPPSRDASINHAGLAPGDFDSDGSLDVLAPSQGDLVGAIVARGTLALIPVGPTNPADYRTDITFARFVGINPGDHHFELTVKKPALLLTGTEGVSTAKFSVMVWYTADMNSKTANTPVPSFLTPMPDAEHDDITFSIKIPDTYDVHTSPDLYSVVIRQVVATNVADGENADILDVAPAYVGIISGGTSWPNLRDAGDTLVYVLMMIDDPEPTVDGGVATGPGVPGLDDDEEPRDGEPRR